jgi:hypothetical protein
MDVRIAGSHDPIYQPLDEPDAIRLLRLQPSLDRKSDLRCELFPTRLSYWKNEIFEHYTALSYVWGQTTQADSLVVNGVPFFVTENLQSALRDLRDKERSRLLWVDAICINQADFQERALQVERMTAIYQAASHTIIYLGTETEVDNFFQSIISVGRNHPSYERLLRRPWFHRVWILQELVYSKDPWLQIGNNLRCAWDEFAEPDDEYPSPLHTNSTLDVPSQDPRLSASQQFFQDSKVIPLRLLVEMDEIRSRHHRALRKIKKKPPLLDLLVARRGFGATDPRDMLYAHIGMSNESKFQVDYMRSVNAVFESIARHFLVHKNFLTMLSYVENVDLAQRREGLPSWVPDWTSASSYFPRLIEFLAGYRASSPLPPRSKAYICLENYSVLASVGYRVGYLEAVSECLAVPPIPFNSVVRIQSNMSMSSDAAAAHDLGIAKVYRTIYKFWLLRLGPGWLPPISDSLWDIVHTREFIDTGGSYYCQSLIAWLIWAATPENKNRPLIEDRKLARVGGSLALVPSCAKVGDAICFFHEHSVPFVLRPIDSPLLINLREEIVSGFKNIRGQSSIDVRAMAIDRFQFVGEGFVEGLMFGDAWPYSSSRYGNLQIFALQ